MKTEEEKTTKSFAQKYPWIIIPVILVMGYVVVTEYKSFKANKDKKEIWNDEDFKQMTNQCVLDSKEMGVNYPELTKEYCECSTKQIQTAMTKAQYTETITKSISEQTTILLPIFQDCLTAYQNKIKAEETQKAN